jgi:urate oxidase
VSEKTASEETASEKTAAAEVDIVLGPTRYGKAEVRVVHVAKSGGTHTIRDLNVSIALSGDQQDTHLTGDNAKVLTTDAQKNAVFALAKRHGVGAPETFASLLARHFLATCPYIDRARVAVEEYPWGRIPDVSSRHSFVRTGGETRTALVHHDADGTHSVVSGLKDLVVLNSTGSEFHGFYKDEYTTLRETRDRILATAVNAQWRHTDLGDERGADDWDKAYEQARGALLAAFADTYSRSLQQTLYAMGRRLLLDQAGVCEVRLALPNRHHFAADLSPFGLDNDNEVFYVADRPYGLIEGTVTRVGAPDPGRAWE